MKYKTCVKIAGFLAVLVILLRVFSAVFDGGYWFQKRLVYDRNARVAALSLEPEGQIDVINIGDSLSSIGVLADHRGDPAIRTGRTL